MTLINDLLAETNFHRPDKVVSASIHTGFQPSRLLSQSNHLSDIMFDMSRTDVPQANNFGLNNGGGSFCGSQQQRFNNVNNYSNATYNQQQQNGNNNGYGDFYQQNGAADGMILMTSGQPGDADHSAMPAYMAQPYSNGECQYDPNAMGSMDQSQFSGHNNFNDYCSYYPSGPYEQQKPMVGQVSESHYAGQHHYPNGTFLPPYHSSPTSSSYTSTGSDESDDMFGFPFKTSPTSGEFDAKGKKLKPGKKRKPKRDPNEPQKPVSAYALFFRDTQAAIKGQNPNASFGEVSKIVASMWDGLDTEAKNIYKQKTEAAKKDYLKQLAAYRASLVSKGGNPVMESFAEFSQAQRKLLNSVQNTPDSTTAGHHNNHSASDLVSSPVASDVGEKSLASLIAEVVPQQVLTATTTLTVPPSYIPARNKCDYEVEPVDPSNPVCVRVGCNRPSVEDPSWDNEYCSTECVVTHCRDLFSSWVQPGSLPKQGTFTPV